MSQTAQKLYYSDFPTELYAVEDYNSVAMNSLYYYMRALKDEVNAHEAYMNTHIVLLKQQEAYLKTAQAEIEDMKRAMLYNYQFDKPVGQVMQQRDKVEKLMEYETERLAHLEHQVKESCQRFFLLFDYRMIRHPYPFSMPKKKGREIPQAMPEFQSTYIPVKWQQKWQRYNELEAYNYWNYYYCQVNYMNDDFYAQYYPYSVESYYPYPAQEYNWNYAQGDQYDYEGGQRDYYNE